MPDPAASAPAANDDLRAELTELRGLDEIRDRAVVRPDAFGTDARAAAR